MLKPLSIPGGYLQVHLCKNGKYKNKLVHRLVAQMFIPNPSGLPEVNHKDENKINNTVANLEWCGRKYNANFGTCNKRSAKANTNGKLSKSVLQFTPDGRFVKRWPSMMEVQRQNGFAQRNISACCRGKYNQAYGYRWQYAGEHV